MNPTSYFNRYIGEVLSQGTKWYNENIYYRKAYNGMMKTFIIARHKMV
jgi:hypothetical protein